MKKHGGPTKPKFGPSQNSQTTTTIQTQLQEANGEAGIYVADNGVYSEANMKQLNQTGVKWVSQVSETLTEAKMLVQEGSKRWP